MSVDDLQRALLELRHGTGDADRRRDLQQFLLLSVAELNRAQNLASERLRDIIEQAAVIQPCWPNSTSASALGR